MDLQIELEKELDSELEKHLSGKAGHSPKILSDSIRYSIFTPGKRIRPRLLLTTGKMLGLKKESLIPAAAALEFIHCFTLIHDDLPCMDDDDMRRGQPSNHKKFGEDVALLAGDALQAIAVDAFLNTPLPADVVLEGLRKFQDAVGPRGVIGGQAAESGLLQPEATLSDLQWVHAQKTGALFLASILVPAAFARIEEASERGQALAAFGKSLGNAFQVADDLEDGIPTDTAKTSVLAYLSPEEAIRSSSAKLTPAMEKISALWGNQSRELILLAEEVLKKLRRAHP
ncbi:MAG: polyprenyl synthetase family protein [Bdellovibrio sp.]|nr:polyprenyl synthetase family protein [Bdellovibrio sp.]